MSYTLDHLIEDYRDNNCPRFIIVVGKEIRGRYADKDSTDMDEGEQLLRKWLSRIDNGTAKVKIFDKVPAKGIDVNTSAYVTLEYQKRYTAEDKNQYWESRGLGSHMMEELRNMRAEIGALKSELEAEPETDDQLEKQAEPQSFLAGIMGNPAVQNIIASFLTNLSANMVSNHVTPQQQQQQYTRPMAMAGIDTSLESTIESLVSKGVTQADFEKLDAMPTERLGFLLSMLRNQ